MTFNSGLNTERTINSNPFDYQYELIEKMSLNSILNYSIPQNQILNQYQNNINTNIAHSPVPVSNIVSNNAPITAATPNPNLKTENFDPFNNLYSFNDNLNYLKNNTMVNTNLSTNLTGGLNKNLWSNNTDFKNPSVWS